MILLIGSFFNLLLDILFLVDLSTSSVEYFDKGQYQSSVTTLNGVRKAVIDVLSTLAQTKNRNIFVYQAVMT